MSTELRDILDRYAEEKKRDEKRQKRDANPYRDGDWKTWAHRVAEDYGISFDSDAVASKEAFLRRLPTARIKADCLLRLPGFAERRRQLQEAMAAAVPRGAHAHDMIARARRLGGSVRKVELAYRRGEFATYEALEQALTACAGDAFTAERLERCVAWAT